MSQNIKEDVKDIMDKTRISFAKAEDSATHAIYTMETGKEFDDFIDELVAYIEKVRAEAALSILEKALQLGDARDMANGGYTGEPFGIMKSRFVPVYIEPYKSAIKDLIKQQEGENK